jgi:hypothetical protein
MDPDFDFKARLSSGQLQNENMHLQIFHWQDPPVRCLEHLELQTSFLPKCWSHQSQV